MSIKIVLPKGNKLKSGVGAKIYTDTGTEITGVLGLNVHIYPNDLITATIEVDVSDIENLSGIAAEFPNLQIDFIESEVAKHGYKLVKMGD